MLADLQFILEYISGDTMAYLLCSIILSGLILGIIVGLHSKNSK